MISLHSGPPSLNPRATPDSQANNLNRHLNCQSISHNNSPEKLFIQSNQTIETAISPKNRTCKLTQKSQAAPIMPNANTHSPDDFQLILVINDSKISCQSENSDPSPQKKSNKIYKTFHIVVQNKHPNSHPHFKSSRT